MPVGGIDGMPTGGTGRAPSSSSSEPTDSGIDKTSSSESGPYAPISSSEPFLLLSARTLIGSEVEASFFGWQRWRWRQDATS